MSKYYGGQYNSDDKKFHQSEQPSLILNS